MKKIVLLFLLTPLFLVAQTPEQLTGWITPPDGWKKGEKVEVFNPETLYERINGAADAFLACKFEEMTTLDLLNVADNSQYINISMYRHASVADAFCIYTAERSPDLEFLPIGSEGYVAGGALHFLAGSMYVKMRSHASDPAVLAAIRSIATSLAKKIEPDPQFPKLLSAMPEENRIPRSDTYISENYMGYSFLHSAFQVSYSIGDKEYAVYIIDAGSPAEAQAALTAYLKQAKSKDKAGEGEFTIADPYNGEMKLLVKQRFIIGITMESEPPITPSVLLKQIASRLP